MSEIDNDLISETINNEFYNIFNFENLPKKEYNFFNILRPAPYLIEIINNIDKDELRILY